MNFTEDTFDEGTVVVIMDCSTSYSKSVLVLEYREGLWQGYRAGQERALSWNQGQIDRFVSNQGVGVIEMFSPEDREAFAIFNGATWTARGVHV
jgi:hypothetical protein